MHLLRAVAVATSGLGHTRPNPPVGAVVVKGGRVIGEGFHAYAGGPHAEVAALSACRVSPRGATVYVSLEPCSRPGLVGACTDALIAAGVKRVVYACKDPNPKNRGRAKRVLARAGIKCECFPLPEAETLVAPFAKHVTTGLPFVTVKLAMSLDGRICDRWGDAKWVSCAEARRVTGHLREQVDAIMVGGETVRRDDPSLLPHDGRNDDLIRVVISKSGRLPKNAKLFTDGLNPTFVYRDPLSALRELGRLGVMHVLCEGGLKLAVSLAEAGLVDEWITVLAPKVIGSRHIADAVQLENVRCLRG